MVIEVVPQLRMVYYITVQWVLCKYNVVFYGVVAAALVCYMVCCASKFQHQPMHCSSIRQQPAACILPIIKTPRSQ